MRNSIETLQSELAAQDKRSAPKHPAKHKAEISQAWNETQKAIRDEFERKRLEELLAAQEREHQRRLEAERKRQEETQKREHERREKLRDKPRPIIPRKFEDKRVTRLYALFQDCFPKEGGFTCRGDWVDEALSLKAWEILHPCFDGEPNADALSTQILKLIHADAGDPRLTVDERTQIFQLFYQSCVSSRKTNVKQEDKICL
ncbi:hypothetical protein [Ahrensia marina]|uniref:Uncharacterized protein n=1 Tax=Ahrensia marina TaxID=1514904 RepID=A0A0M9GKK1_9HYPH|nr:hypothetical protein [Ahrensia marina]KPA99929.1 hypothetical protein SU32_16500 [Ahrensia marina]